MGNFGILLLWCSLLCMLRISSSIDVLSSDQSIRDGGETLISSGGSFELGFFGFPNSLNRYLGIWYKKISEGTIVWVANRGNPVIDDSGVLNITDKGVLVVANSTRYMFWSSNTSRTVQNPVAQLLDSGNFVVRDVNDENPENFLWQSFDYPCDTLLPGMKLGRKVVTGLDRYLSSWRTVDDPAPGIFSFRIDPRGFPQLVLRRGSVIQYRSGSWNGLRWSGTPELKPNPLYTFEFVSNATDVFYKFDLVNASVISRLVLNQSGTVQRFTWIDRTRGWALFSTVQIDQCDNYALCGAYGICNINNATVCGCPEGFAPSSPRDWALLDWTHGCVRKTPLDCNGDGFLKNKLMKLPDTSGSWVNTSMSLEDCRARCLRDCNCTAYASSDIRDGGHGCLLWFNDLLDIRVFTDEGQDLYIRMAASEIARIERERRNHRKRHVAIIISTVLAVTGVLILGLTLYLRKKQLKRKEMAKNNLGTEGSDGEKEKMELPLFDLPTIISATNNFLMDNKLGEGGFGPVYKGTLMNGQEIAVKRLSKDSGQGLHEFKNEVILIAKLQHRNLVKLLGCCIQGKETMLIYEYMPNKSLDSFIFDQTRSKILDWNTRLHIIGGIARGLLYLHQDSRLRIIHRDLKASNVLLDSNLNPKISDFGLARTFGGDQTEGNTSRVVGTYGYMSPEYAVDGLFSVKSDVFSFGVLVLEIVSGKKNRGFSHPDHQLNLLGHAWWLWTEGKPLELIDDSLGESCQLSEVFRCIHVGLLCVQQRPEDRPNMSSAVLMLGSETPLPPPKQPGFFTDRNLRDIDSSSSKPYSHSANEITVTLLQAR